jgi:exodeoxyribonuclease V gamma subunit
LGDGRFPAADGPDPLDLTSARHETGYVSLRERDKYLFLETLVCARDCLYLSYVARDAQTGDKLNPSPVVHELMRHLHGEHSGKPSDKWVKHQPLHRFDDAYFPREKARNKPAQVLPNFSAAAWKEFQARQFHESLWEYCDGIPPLTPGSLRRFDRSLVNWLCRCSIDCTPSHAKAAQRIAISLGDLLRFLKCPLQGWARLMLPLGEDEADDKTAHEDEPFTTGRLGETSLLREVFLTH